MSFKIFKIRTMQQINLCTGMILTPFMLFGLSHSTMAATPQNPQFSSSKAVYVGRTQPDSHYYPYHGAAPYHPYPPYLSHNSRVIKQSTGYGQDKHVQHAGNKPGVSANIYYQAPSTTTITRNVQVIPPQNSVGDVYYSQDRYYFPAAQPVYRPYYQRPYQPLIPVTVDPQDTESRSKQWTDKSDFNR